ncbi:MAG TPA: GNAT family N-acetyltransferase [Ktedonosporobacter sp.]|nr:GNAT family N-acetyltransferase [Ktedonosporobacter sp.]
MPAQHGQVRLLSTHDIPAIERLLHTSEYIYQRFTLDELPLLLRHAPAAGLFNGASLHGFLLSQTLNPPSAWIGGFGVSWTESRAYLKILHTLLDHLSARLLTRGIHHLYYSGNDLERDWLRSILLTQGFAPYRHLYAYDKFDYGIPTNGNQQVTIRPVRLNPAGESGDMAELLAIEEVCFEDLWRYNSTAFIDIAATHPYFVVAELDGKVVGYQFNALDGDFGYLIRIAVHPTFSGRGIGARLMAEGVRFFTNARVSRILLNTQDDNAHAHRLYEWFGFIRVQQMGFVLRKYL